MQNFKFGRRQVSDISRSDVSAIIDKLADRRSTQSHSLVMIKVFFTWCMYQGYIEHSPVTAIQARPRGPSRDRTLTDKELIAVWRAATHEPYPFGPIVRLLILTGQRRTEIASLRWSWINFDTEEIVYPADFTKNRRPHTLPFTKSVRDILEALPRIDKSDYVFPAARKTAKGKETTVFNGWWKCKKALDEKLEGVAPYNIHDLRRTFSSKMAELGTPIHVTEKLLNHVSGSFGGVAGIYNRYTYLPEMRQALEAYDARLKTLVATAI
jgi:integrase